MTIKLASVSTETKIGVPFDELADALSVGGGDQLDLKLACGEGTEEAGLRYRAELPSDQVRGFRDDEGGSNERYASPIA